MTWRRRLHNRAELADAIAVIQDELTFGDITKPIRRHPDQPELALTPAGERIRARQAPMPPLEPAEPTEGERQLMQVEYYDGEWRMPRGWRDR